MRSRAAASTAPNHAEHEGVSWHALSEHAVVLKLSSSADGLTAADAAARLRKYGPNAVVRRRQESWLEEFAESFTEPLQLLLVVVAVLSFVFGERGDAFAIVGVILLSAAVETTSQVRAVRAITALDALSAPHARVWRGGTQRIVPAGEVVPGDVLLLEVGDIAVADGRIVQAHGLRVDESGLTGEAVSAGKSPTTLGPDVDLADRANMVYTGTAVVDGQARAVVVATGAHTELGRLGAAVAAQKEPPTGLQRAMTELARLVLVLALVVSTGVPLLGVLLGQPVKDMLLTGLSLAFATVPEELPILVTVLLAVGGLQLARRGALLRRLGVGETDDPDPGPRRPRPGPDDRLRRSGRQHRQRRPDGRCRHRGRHRGGGRPRSRRDRRRVAVRLRPTACLAPVAHRRAHLACRRRRPRGGPGRRLG